MSSLAFPGLVLGMWALYCVSYVRFWSQQVSVFSVGAAFTSLSFNERLNGVSTGLSISQD